MTHKEARALGRTNALEAIAMAQSYGGLLRSIAAYATTLEDAVAEDAVHDLSPTATRAFIQTLHRHLSRPRE
jgi:hypothetical protein